MRPLLAALLLSLPWAGAAAFDSGRATFSITVNGLSIPYRVFAVYTMPGSTLEIRVPGAAGKDAAITGDSRTAASESGTFRWTVRTSPGVEQLVVSSGAERVRLNIFVMRPANSVRDGYLNGFRIGQYPAKPLHGNPVYLPPKGYVELNQETASLELSPHFSLSQFPSKQVPDEFPKYLVLRETLLIKLELLLEEINRRGIEADTLTIMSGYRTPYYNAAIGNVQYSRHVYGGAADIYVDVSPVDDVMDDLNGDGKSNYVDAQLLYTWANALFREPQNSHLAGGLGVYERNPAHGPFLHMDARGQRARWGIMP
jgi:Peptidase M15